MSSQHLAYDHSRALNDDIREELKVNNMAEDVRQIIDHFLNSEGDRRT